MEKIIRSFLTGLFLLAFLGLLPQGAMAQETDGKIKRLEALEARIDAKLKRLEDLEARLEARLETGIQPVAARSPGVAAASGNTMRRMPLAVPSASVQAVVPGQDWEYRGGQVSFRTGYTNMDSAARSATFTGGNTERGGFMAGGALDVPLMKDPWMNNTLLGQISVDFSGLDGSTAFAVTGAKGRQSLLKIAISPKYRFDNLGEYRPWLRNVRPWIIPIGIAFLLNTPPSEAVTYATVGGTTGFGVEYVLRERFALGLAFSYNFYDRGRNDIESNHLSVGPYVGINY